MTITRLLRERLRGLRGGEWRDACPAGAPLPETSRCAALDCDSRNLTTLAVGEQGTVSCLEAPEGHAAWKLAAMGVLPGARLTLVQRRPVYVFRIGYSEFAVDEELAGHVRVRLCFPQSSSKQPQGLSRSS